MAQYRILFSPRASKDVKKLPRRIQDRLKEILVAFEDNPMLGKKLKGELEGKYSYRVWPYRIIYTIYKEKLIIYILRIQHRQGVYR